MRSESRKSASTILLLDDQKSIRRLLAHCVHAAVPGATLLEARSNAEALGIVGARQVDTVIQDYQRLAETGVDFAIALRSLPVRRPVVLVFSGTARPTIAAACEERNFTVEELFDGVIPKPDTDALDRWLRLQIK